MKDSFNREIDYLRISVTDRCNLRCHYCMPEEGIETSAMNELLSYEEITRVCEEAAKLGIKKIRLTGGEPLVRQDLPKLVGMIHNIPGITSIAITTNGILLPKYIDELVDNGLTGVNISLDTMDPVAFKNITGRDQLNEVLNGIQTALRYDIKVKVNAVLLPEEFYITDSEEPANWVSLLELPEKLPLDLRFIELMPIGVGKKYYQIPAKEVLRRLQDAYPEVYADHSVHGSGPAVYYNIPGFRGSIGLIEAIHGKFCHNCNRIRLSATGQIKPCLCYSDIYDIKDAVRNGTPEDISAVLQKAIAAKPSAHCFEQLAEISEDKKMVSIGG